jgi:acetyl esterase/lipase
MPCVDPQLAAIARLLPPPEMSDPIRARAWIKEILDLMGTTPTPSWTERVDVMSRSAPAAAGHEIPIRVYLPRGTTSPRGALVHFHGGAFVMGDLDLSAPGVGRIADRANIVVVDVDYRLAPEHPFPVGFDDCYAALEWTAANHAELGIDRARIAVGGESAGGALAAAVVLAARDRGGPPVAFQLLMYPVIDDRLVTASVRTMTDTPVWNAPSAVHMWNHYLGPAETRGDVSPYAAPWRAIDTARGLADLPPTYLLACEHDPLRDEDLAYAQALVAAGVSVDFRLIAGTFHGFDGFPTAISKRTSLEMIDVLRHAVGE